MIPTISYEEMLRRFDEAKGWLETLKIPIDGTRFGEYYNNLKKLVSWYRNGTRTELSHIMSVETAYYSLTESNAFISIYEAFKDIDQNHLPKNKLRMMLDGPPFPNGEVPGNANVNPRNTLFEIELATRFIKAGFKVNDFQDINFDFNEFRINVECKRPHTRRSITANIERGGDQLLERDPTHGRTSKNIIAISVDKVFEIDRRILFITDEQDIEKEVEKEVGAFRETYHKTLNRLSDKNILALLLVFKFMSIVRPQALLTSVFFVGGIPLKRQIGNLILADHKLLEDIEKQLKQSGF
jgi:hypothetical protein